MDQNMGFNILERMKRKRKAELKQKCYTQCECISHAFINKAEFRLVFLY